MKIKNLFADSKSDAVDSRCIKCGLGDKCQSPRMEVSGGGEKEVLVIGEAPGFNEDQIGTQWVGKAGEFLRTALRMYDLDLDEDCWKTNAVSCRLTKGNANRKPTKKEIGCCRYRVLEAIGKYKPKFILLCGGVAITSVLGPLFTKLDISKLHGYIIPVVEYNAWVISIYHPSYVMRNEKDRNLQTTFKRDIEKAVRFIEHGKPIPQYDYTTNLEDVHLLTKIKDVEAAFDRILQTDAITSFDYETTGRKPFKEEQKIVAMAISTEHGTYSFPVDYQNFWNDNEYKTVVNLICDYLVNANIPKTAHNGSFEKLWSQEIFGINPQVCWCTMDTAHILDHRKGICGLKFQAFSRWGIDNYDQTSQKYIKSDTANGLNRMDEMPLGDLLLYNALDAKLTRLLYFKQKEEITKKQEVGRKLFLDTAEVFLDCQLNGLPVNKEYYLAIKKELTTEIDKLSTELVQAPEIRKYTSTHIKPFSEASVKDLRELLFQQMKIQSKKQTAGGSKSVDAGVLSEIDHPIPIAILAKRKLLKLRDTYLAQFLREETKGFIHPNFLLNVARSLRSSASNPSFQNIPKRDKKAKETVRRGIVPSPKCVLLECDFCFTGDTLIETNEGPIPIIDIVNSKEQKFVYCYNHKEGRVGFGKVLAGKKTKENSKVLKITLDNGKEIKCSPEHKFMLRDGTYKEAQKLTIFDSLMPLYKKVKRSTHKTKYYAVGLNKTGNTSHFDADTEHSLLCKDILKIKTGREKGAFFVHHKDGNGLNNKLDNLEIMTRKEHFSIHSKQEWENSPEGNKNSIDLPTYRSKYNHKIISIEFCSCEDLYNITVEEHHNYALSAGVIVKNCGIEVMGSSFYHKDPNFVKYLTDKESDMHLDLTLQLWKITKEQCTKMLRFFTKNCWTFPQFYGDFFGSCAEELWKNCIEDNLSLANGTLLIKHLKKVGLGTFTKFTDHCKKIEDDMWNVRFPVYTKWKNDINEFYQKNGYVETFFGFKFTDYLDKKQATNYPIQSTAAHLLFWSLIQVSKKIEKAKMTTCIIGQIHDSMILDVPKVEIEKVVKIIKQVCEVDLFKQFDWVLLPMKVEIEISKVLEEGGNFSAMEILE